MTGEGSHKNAGVSSLGDTRYTRRRENARRPPVVLQKKKRGAGLGAGSRGGGKDRQKERLLSVWGTTDCIVPAKGDAQAGLGELLHEESRRGAKVNRQSRSDLSGAGRGKLIL